MFDINIIIVNYNMKAELNHALSSLFSDIADSALDVSVVVVDNASSDDSLTFLKEKFSRVKIISLDSNNGFGAAQNLGLSSIQAKYHFILNPDTYFFPGEKTLRKLFDFMEREQKIGMIGPKILYPDGSLQYSCYRFPTFWHPLLSRTKFGEGKGKKHHHRLIMKDYDHSDRRPVDWVMGSAMFARATALLEVGKFDEQFWMYYEDSDLCRRFWEKGWAVYYVPDIKIEHVHSRRSAEIPGVISSVLKNKYARVHIYSWLKYMWKWRGNNKYYN